MNEWMMTKCLIAKCDIFILNVLAVKYGDIEWQWFFISLTQAQLGFPAVRITKQVCCCYCYIQCIEMCFDGIVILGSFDRLAGYLCSHAWESRTIRTSWRNLSAHYSYIREKTRLWGEMLVICSLVASVFA